MKTTKSRKNENNDAFFQQQKQITSFPKEINNKNEISSAEIVTEMDHLQQWKKTIEDNNAEFAKSIVQANQRKAALLQQQHALRHDIEQLTLQAEEAERKLQKTAIQYYYLN